MIPLPLVFYQFIFKMLNDFIQYFSKLNVPKAAQNWLEVFPIYHCVRLASGVKWEGGGVCGGIGLWAI